LEQNEDKTIPSILKRLDKIEAELFRIKEILLPKEDIQTRAIPAPSIKPKEEIVRREEKFMGKEDSKLSLENVIGTKWIGRVGMIAIIFGIAFFLKYSFDNKLIGETGRIILGIFCGSCFIGAGEYFQKKKNWPTYGQILTGGGFSILYFSIYAAFAFYHLVSQFFAFVALIAITTTGITLSIRYSAISIAVIGILGGFLTPLILSTGENRPISLFSYIMMLDIGIMLVVYFKQWHSIGIASLIGTILMYTAWHGKFYTIDQQLTAFSIVTVFFFFYNLYVLFSSFKRKVSYAEQAIIILSAAFYLISFYSQNQHENNWNLKSFTLAISFIEILFATLLLRLSSEGKSIIYNFTGASVVFNIISIFAIFEKSWITAALAAEMVIFTYIGIRLNKFPLRFIAYILGILSFIRFFLIEVELILGPFERYNLFFNRRFLICSFVIAAFYITLSLLVKNKDNLIKDEPKVIIPGTLIITQFLSVFLLSIEFYDFYKFSAPDRFIALTEFKYARQLSLSIIWALYASVITGIGIVKKIRLLRILGIILIGATIFKVFLIDLSELKTIYRITSFIILGLLLLAVSYLYNRFKHLIFGENKYG